MKLQTPVVLAEGPELITPPTTIFSLGSCFSECLPERLERVKFRLSSNPCGISYNPISISQQLTALLERKPLSSITIVEGEAYPLAHHGSFKAPTVKEQERLIHAPWKEAEEGLAEAELLLITLGTAYVFTYDGKVVNNCHRLPQRLFTEELLTVGSIVAALEGPILSWIAQHKARRAVLSLSPVRHLRNGLQGNAVSKATLRLAINRLCEHTGVYYFPAYELLLDELRDYRFYRDDLLHPSKLAEELIWARFQEWIFSERGKQIAQACELLSRSLEHRFSGAVDPVWMKALWRRLASLEERFPELDWGEEAAQIKYKGSA
jgi:hypothetical protein